MNNERNLLQMMFEHQRWEELIEKADEKKIPQAVLKELCKPSTRAYLYERIVTKNYEVAPAHLAQIPKDKPGEFREVHVNEDVDRLVLTLINDCLFELFPHYVHKNCTSYQKGLSCQKTVQAMAKKIAELSSNNLGYKADLTKYFDSVNRDVIFGIFDRMEDELGIERGSDPAIAILRTYYNTDLLFDLDGNLVTHYGSLKQGCAVASFLSNAVLYDVDEELSNMDGIEYCRYSDDLLILGESADEAKEILEARLAEYGLSLNPKKVEALTKDKWFKFLGFSIKNDMITLSAGRVKKFQKAVVDRTINNPRITEAQAKRNLIKFLYEGEYNWGSSCLSTINCKKDIEQMNLFVMDCLRAVKVREMKGKKGKISISKIGGLGTVDNMESATILRGKGSNVARNRKLTEKVIKNYLTVGCLHNAITINKAVFEACVRGI